MDTKKIIKIEEEMGEIQFGFRQGFSGRVNARLENIISQDPALYFFQNLSNLLPKIIALSAIIILLFTLGLVLSSTEINMEAFLGTQTLDENNFISYLILE